MRYLYVSLFIVLAGSFAIAEEMPLPFSSSDLSLSNRNEPTLAARPHSSDSSIRAKFVSPESYSERSFKRFQRNGSYSLAQLGDEFPTDYMQEPELDSQTQPEDSTRGSEVEKSAASEHSPQDIPPAPGSDELVEVPPPPSQAEIENMFGESASPPPEFSSTVEVGPHPPVELQFSAPVQAAMPLRMQTQPSQNRNWSCTK